MAMVINHLVASVMQVGRWSGSAVAVAFVLSSAAARADEPPAPPAPAVAAQPPAVAAPTSAVPASSTPNEDETRRARLHLPKRIRDTTVLKPDVLPAKEGEWAPAGYHEEERIRTGTVVSGALLFGIPYTISVISGAQAVQGGDNHAAAVLFPIVGPFIMMGFPRKTVHGFEVLGVEMLLLVDGLMQVGGVAAITAGLLAKRRVFVLDEVNKSFVMPMPMRFGANSAGVGVVGTF